MNSQSSRAHRIIGFDFGDGESELAETRRDAHGDPDMLSVVGRKSTLTCIGYRADGSIRIGDDAITDSAIRNLLVRFKRAPSHSQFNATAVRDFFKFCIDQVLDGESLSDTSVIVGAPSGWSQADRDAYRRVLQSAGVPQLSVIPESRAAFLHAKESSRLTLDDLKTTAVVIDIGSSTTDFTVVSEMRETVRDTGHVRLGAGLIESALLDETVRQHPQKEHIERVFAGNPHRRAACEIEMRRMKESYFNALKAGYDSNSLRAQLAEVDEVFTLRLQLNDARMQHVLKMALTELDGVAWVDAFRDKVQEIADAHTESPIRAILLTGGGANMPFTHEIVKRVFPEARIILDEFPEFAIARGLARVGRLDVKIAELREELRRCATKIRGRFLDRFPAFKERIGEAVGRWVVSNLVEPNLVDWRKGRIASLNDLEASIKDSVQDASGSERFKGVLFTAVSEWFGEEREFLIGSIRSVLVQFGIPLTSIERQFDGVSVSVPSEFNMPSQLAGTISGVIATIVGLIVGSICGGTGLALVAAGPLGFIPGVIAAGAVWVWGKQPIEDAVKSIDIPLRGMFYNDNWQDKVILKAERDVRARVAIALEAKRDELADGVSEQLSATILLQVDSLAFHIAS